MFDGYLWFLSIVFVLLFNAKFSVPFSYSKLFDSEFGRYVPENPNKIKTDTRLKYEKSTHAFTLDISGIRNVSILDHFWKSTGLCPPAPHQEAYKYFSSPDMQQNLAYIGSVPQGGIQQVRIHWLLDLVTVKGFQEGRPNYDFSKLDDLIQLLYDNGLQPGFELMGNPSNIFTNLENKTQVYWWRDLIQQLAENYIAQYGGGYLSRWRFETWNEPDHHDFDPGLNITVQGFLNYYDACSEGLKRGSGGIPLIFGGPGGSCRSTSFSKICWALLNHVENGLNFFTGQKGNRIDFISFHKKGHLPNNSAYIIQSELETIDAIWSKYPGLKHVPIVNDEGDPLVGWSRLYKWRADVTYASMVAKIVAQHQKMILAKPGNKINYSLLSNDNGFLSYFPAFFEQRTLLARFQINNTEVPYTTFVRKPVLSVMGLLGLLGETQIEANIVTVDGKVIEDDADVDVLATTHHPQALNGTSDSWQASVMIYFSRDTNPCGSNDTVSLNVNITGLQPTHKGKDMRLVVYYLDGRRSNPYNVWLHQGRPVFPSISQLTEMRLQEGPIVLQAPKVFLPEIGWDTTLELTCPGVVALIHICDKPDSPPDQTNGLAIQNITVDQVLISWSDKCINTRCIKTYEVERSSTLEGPYTNINLIDTIFTSIVFAPVSTKKDDTLVRGFYRVRAVDYWGQHGEYSLPLQYPDTGASS